MILQIILGLFGLVLLAGVVYLNTSPQMGGRASHYDSPNFSGGKFRNLVPTPMSSNGYSMWQAAYEFFFNKDRNSYPQTTLPARALSRQEMDGRSSEGVAVTWLGHSMALVTGKDVTVITDPVFNGGKLPPLAMGPKPFPYAATYDVGDLPDIDVVLISHDHFDHLDMESIRKLKGSSFYVPLGVKSHLLAWGIDETHVHEFDWYEEKAVSRDLELVFAPARHFSGRGLWNGKSTLWGSWVIKLEGRKIYYGGDSGYFDEFKKIGATYGPFDLVMLDNGQYNRAWQALHMLPEEVVQAGRDLRADVLLPVHWGKYVLSLHSWYEPIERITDEARKRDVMVTTPRPGEPVLLDRPGPTSTWWRQYRNQCE